MRIVTMVVVLALTGAAAAPLAAQAPPVRVDLTGRVHVQWSSTSLDESEAGDAAAASSTFEMRRVRLAGRIRVGDWITALVEPDFAMSRLRLKSGWVALELDSALVLRAGQFKKPFSLIELTSSTQYPAIERGTRIRGLSQYLLLQADPPPPPDGTGLAPADQQELLGAQLYSGRDIGAALEGRRGPLGWSVGLFNGAGGDRQDHNDAKSLAGRVTWTAAAAGTPLRVGAGWSRREGQRPATGETRTGNAFEVDAELGGFRRGWWLLGEVAGGSNVASGGRFIGAHGLVSRFVATGGERVEGVEPLVRVSYGDPDDGAAGDAGTLVTPGVNLYFFGRNRLMLNWDAYLPENDGAGMQHAARVQLNVHF